MSEDRKAVEAKHGGWYGDPEIIKAYALPDPADVSQEPPSPPIQAIQPPADEEPDEDARRADYAARAAKARETRAANQKAKE